MSVSLLSDSPNCETIMQALSDVLDESGQEVHDSVVDQIEINCNDPDFYCGSGNDMENICNCGLFGGGVSFDPPPCSIDDLACSDEAVEQICDSGLCVGNTGNVTTNPMVSFACTQCCPSEDSTPPPSSIGTLDAKKKGLTKKLREAREYYKKLIKN